jgi:GMP synthase (glutamine-hydrolysing)
MSEKSPSARPRKITIVRTGEPVPPVRARRGEFHDLIQRAIGDAWSGDYDVVDVRPEDAAFPAPASAAAFVITGSAAYVPDREPWVLRTEAWLREVVGAGAAVFGICFGHQLLAQALGGEVQKNPRGREMGTVPVDRSGDDPLFAGVPERFLANVTHLDTVIRPPPGAAVLARSAKDEHQAIRFAERCYGVQFHPEMDGEVIRGYVEARREALEAEGFAVEAMLAEATDAESGREALRNWVRFL